MGLRLLSEEEVKKLSVFDILDWASGGECDEHRGSGLGSALVRDYAYIYPGGSVTVHRITIGWVCAGCLYRGYANFDCGAVRIVPLDKLESIDKSVD